MGRHRGGRRCRLDGAVPLLRVQAPLPVRDPGRGGAGQPRGVRPRSSPSTRTSSEALTAVLNGAFELTELEVLRNRVLVAEQNLVGVQRTSPREEEARRLARSRMRDLEFAWATFLTRGMEQGAIPRGGPAPARARDPRPLQQRLALVPPEGQHVARRGQRLLRAALSGHGGTGFGRWEDAQARAPRKRQRRAAAV